MRLISEILGWTRRGSVNLSVNASENNVGILTSGENASITYLVEPYLALQGQSGVRIFSDAVPPRSVSDVNCGVIIILRYLPKHWISFLRQFRASGGKLIYFMDDDLMDSEAMAGLPVGYAKKIHKLSIQRRAELEKICHEFWVASPYLAKKYHSWSPVLLTPQPGFSELANDSVTTICYHGTASHQAELEWLVPVIKSVAETNQMVSFEVFGDHSVNRLFRNLPRTSVLHPMSWSNYLTYTSGIKRDIALAPLLPLPFNAARGPTKFFDFTRMGAVGIYSDVAPYHGFIRENIDGLLLPNDPDSWVRNILYLINDVDRRKCMAQMANERALSMVWNAQE